MKLSDTDAAALDQQVRLMKAAGPAGRFAAACSLGRVARALSRRALCRQMPEGRLIAFVSNRTEEPDANYNTDIWLVEPDNPDQGKTLVQVTTGRGQDFGLAIWRDWGGPDGRDVLAAVDVAIGAAVSRTPAVWVWAAGRTAAS